MLERLAQDVSSIDGWLTDSETRSLIRVTQRELIQFGTAATLAEVGSYSGKSTVAIAATALATAPGSCVYAIDPHTGDVGAVDTALGVQPGPSTLDAFRETIEKHGVDDIVCLVRQRSFEVRWNKPINLLFVDGLHDYLSVSQDVTHFADWVIDDGYIVFHDYCDTFPGVQRCVDELLQAARFSVDSRVDSLIVLRRFANGYPRTRSTQGAVAEGA